VYEHADLFIDACVRVCICVCMYIHVYMFVYACLTALFSFEKRKRCDDNQQAKVIHFGQNKRLNLEISKSKSHIISNVHFMMLRLIF